MVSLESWKEGKKKTGLKKTLEEIMTKDFPNLAKGIKLQIQEAEQITNKISQKNFTSSSIRLLKRKDKVSWKQ